MISPKNKSLQITIDKGLFIRMKEYLNNAQSPTNYIVGLIRQDLDLHYKEDK